MNQFRPGNFQILPPIIKNLVIINVLVFMAESMLGTNIHNFIVDTFALHSWQSPLFRPWQPLTHLFLHGSVGHIFGNMFALWMFGSVLENLWGGKRFLLFYLVCGLGAALCHLSYLYFSMGNIVNDYANLKANFDYNHFVSYVQSHQSLFSRYPNLNQFLSTWKLNPNDQDMTMEAMHFSSSSYAQILNEATLGASGAVFGVLAAFGYLFPNTYLYFYFFIPIKTKWFVLGYMAYELFMSIQNSAGDDIAHVAHLGGGVIGFILVYYWNRRNRKDFY